jgi:acyl-CoA synthetase (AMP-forming)/AMP-acid ligase II
MAGELCVTGRVKELIIIAGRNIYPQDLEGTIAANPSSNLGRSVCAFSIEDENEERLVVVQELGVTSSGGPNFDEHAVCVRDVVWNSHELALWRLVLVRAGSLPKTTSGKLQRRQCRADFMRNDLNPLFTWPTGSRPFSASKDIIPGG